MFSLKEWLRNRRERSDAEWYDKGYSWTLLMIVKHKKRPEEIADLIHPLDNEWQPFDYGCRDAVEEYQRIMQATLLLGMQTCEQPANAPTSRPTKNKGRQKQ